MSSHPCWCLLLVRSRTYPTLVSDWMETNANMGTCHPTGGMSPPDHQSWNLPKRDKDKLFSKLDLKSISEWSEYDQNQVCELMKEYQHLFALDDLKLGSTSQIKHEIKLSDPKPFKDRYRRIPPQQFEEVRAHLQDMLKVGAIRKTTSPWASPMILVRKKDGSLRFCIDLRKLNSRTIKDAYSLPRIEELLE